MNTYKILNLLFIIIFSVSNISAQSKKEKKAFKTEINDLIKNWQDPSNDFQDFPEASSFVPEYGIRVKYYLNKNMLSLAKLTQLVGEPIFLSGPHKNDMDFSAESFGYYNPKFLKKLIVFTRNIVSSKKFIKKNQAFYDLRLKKYMQTFSLGYQKIMKNPELTKAAIDQYQNFIKDDPSGASFQMQEFFREYTEEMEDNGYNWYELNTSIIFWLRRYMDGSSDEFYQLMQTLMNSFDRGFSPIK